MSICVCVPVYVSEFFVRQCVSLNTNTEHNTFVQRYGIFYPNFPSASVCVESYQCVCVCGFVKHYPSGCVKDVHW